MLMKQVQIKYKLELNSNWKR